MKPVLVMFRFSGQSKWAAACLGLAALLCTELLIESVDGAVEVWRQVASLRLLMTEEASPDNQGPPTAKWWSYLSQACRGESTSATAFAPLAPVTTCPSSYTLPLEPGVNPSPIPHSSVLTAWRHRVRSALMNLPPPSGPIG